MLGSRLFAWADMTIFILDHLHDVMLIGKTSVAGKGKVEGKKRAGSQRLGLSKEVSCVQWD